MGFGLITNLSCIPTHHHRYRLVVDFRWISISLMLDRIQLKAVGVFNQVFFCFSDIQTFIISTVAGCCSSIVYTSENAETLAFCLNLLYPLVSHDITK